MAMRQIVALGGGGFSEESDNTLLDDYILGLTGRERPRVCFLPTASGDADGYVEKFYEAFTPDRCQPSHLLLVRSKATDGHRATAFEVGEAIEQLLSQHVIYVGGGNTVAMLAQWRAGGIDSILREAWEAGVVLAGISAGSLCWFQAGTTDAFGNGIQPLLDGLGLLPGSHSPHYDSEPERRPRYQELIGKGVLPDGYAADNCVGLHFEGAELVRVVASRPGATGYRVRRTATAVEELRLEATLLSNSAERRGTSRSPDAASRGILSPE